MTDGILLAEIQGDRLLRRYDTLIIDEAHERSLTIDFLLGWLTRILPERPDLKVIVSSATIETERFSEFFGGAPVIQVEGRTYPGRRAVRAAGRTTSTCPTRSRTRSRTSTRSTRAATSWCSCRASARSARRSRRWSRATCATPCAAAVRAAVGGRAEQGVRRRSRSGA